MEIVATVAVTDSYIELDLHIIVVEAITAGCCYIVGYCFLQ